MAFKEVVIPEEQYSQTPAEFFKYRVLGDQIAGWYVGVKEGTYGRDWRFRVKDSATGLLKDVVCTAPYDLNKKLQMALDDKATPMIPGSKVIAKWDRNLPMTGMGKDGKPKGEMKLFAFKYDPENATLPPLPAAVAKPKAADDVPF